QIAVGGKMQQQQIGAAVEHGLADGRKVLAQRHLAAGEVDPEQTGRLPEEALDLVEPQLVARLHLPDVEGLAAVVAPEGDAERELEGKVEAAQVGTGGSARERRIRPQSRYADRHERRL